MSVCRSGLRDLEACSLLVGGVPIPEHRLSRSIDSVPIFSLLWFPSEMVMVPPYPPSKIQCLFPVSSFFLPIASSPSISVLSADHLLQRLVTCCPSVGSLQTSGWLPNKCPLLVSCPASLQGFAPPPPPTCAAGVTWLGCGWRGEVDGAVYQVAFILLGWLPISQWSDLGLWIRPDRPGTP